jgi:hypothetical protein
MNETITSVISADSPAGAPVFIAGTEPKQIPAEKEPEKQTPQAELEALVLGAGCDFNTLVKWGLDTNNIEGADSMGGFDEIPSDIAKRLLRAQAGLLKGLLKGLKGQEETV